MVKVLFIGWKLRKLDEERHAQQPQRRDRLDKALDLSEGEPRR